MLNPTLTSRDNMQNLDFVRFVSAVTIGSNSVTQWRRSVNPNPSIAEAKLHEGFVSLTNKAGRVLLIPLTNVACMEPSKAEEKAKK